MEELKRQIEGLERALEAQRKTYADLLRMLAEMQTRITMLETGSLRHPARPDGAWFWGDGLLPGQVVSHVKPAVSEDGAAYTPVFRVKGLPKGAMISDNVLRCEPGPPSMKDWPPEDIAEIKRGMATAGDIA